jgi:hypothetical protein
MTTDDDGGDHGKSGWKMDGEEKAKEASDS